MRVLGNSLKTLRLEGDLLIKYFTRNCETIQLNMLN